MVTRRHNLAECPEDLIGLLQKVTRLPTDEGFDVRQGRGNWLMGLLHFFQRLFFQRAGDQMACAQPSAHASTPVSVAAVAACTVPRLMLLREELLDSTGRLAGYRFSCGVPEDGVTVTAERYLVALQEAHVRGLAERRLALIAVRLEDVLEFDFSDVVVQGTVFHLLGRPEQLSATSCLALLKALRARGAGVALSVTDDANLALLAPALALATHAMVDISTQPVEPFEQLVIALRKPALNWPSWWTTWRPGR